MNFVQETFQSPRLGEFVSDYFKKTIEYVAYQTFQSPKSGKFVSDEKIEYFIELNSAGVFQSPRSGKFVSDSLLGNLLKNRCLMERFNPLDRGKLYRIGI